MKRALLSLVPVIVLFSARANACPGTAAASVSAAVTQVANALETQSTGFCIAAIGPGSIKPVIACGGETVKGSGVKPDAYTLFEIGSLTKNMTGTLLALRISQSAIALSDPIGPKIGYPFLDSSKTIDTLVHHTSQLPRDPQVPSSSKSDFYQHVNDCFHDSTCVDPTVTYSNYGFEVLGDILAGNWFTWASVNRDEIMTPLGMSYTLTYEQFHQTLPLLFYFGAHAARGHNGGTVMPATDPPTWGAAAGALYSSITEMGTWLQYNMLLAGPSSLTALVPSIRQGRFGWNMDSPMCASSGKYFSKPGSTIGFNSYIGYDTVGQRGAIVLVNDAKTSTPQISITMGQQLMTLLP